MTGDSGHDPLGHKAIVVGGSVAGMMAAGVLARYFKEVLILDKDGLPDLAESRKSVPQGDHAHGLLVQGRLNLEKIFPGFTDELIGAGANWIRTGIEFKIRDAGGWHPINDIDLPTINMTRPLLERTVRRMVSRLPNINFRSEVRIDGWAFSNSEVTGVITRGPDGPETLNADFVIDATGRSGRSLAWLEAGGFGPVEETVIETGICYATALFKIPDNWSNPFKGMSVASTDPDSRGGFIFPVENNCWIVSVTGRFGQQPTNDPDEFMEHAKNLCEPEFYEWVRQGERLTPVKTCKANVSRWRHFDRMERFPNRILPLGDALAHVNPIYGQGMTLSSVYAVQLWDVLEQAREQGGGLDGLSRTYFTETGKFIHTVWSMLEIVEFEYAETGGERPDDIGVRQAFFRGLRRLVDEDPEIHRLFVSSAHLVDGADALRSDEITGRVLEKMQEEADGQKSAV